jgi:AP-2 complex subunit alpha
MREPLCLKIAVLAESFMTDLAWYVDTILTLITLAGDQCHDGVWHRVVQVISMNPQYQRYATLTSFNSMTGSQAHDRLVKLSAQLCGEYAHLIPNSPDEIFTELTKKYPIVSSTTQAMIVSALAKMGGRFAPVRPKVIAFIDPLRASQNIEIQQRAVEYHALLTEHNELLEAVFRPIPPFKPRASFLIKQVVETVDMTPVIGRDEEEEDVVETLADIAPVHASAPAPPTPPPSETKSDPPTPEKLVDLTEAIPGVPSDPVIELLEAPPPATKEGIFKHFLTNDNGVAFEDAVVSVRLIIQSNGPTVFLSFAVSNKSPAPITGVKLHVMPVPFLRANLRPGPATIESHQSGTYQFAFTVLAPYNEPPQYTINYNDVRETVRLPLVITKFMVPFPMSQQVFFERWAQFSDSREIARASYPVIAAGDPTPQMALLMTSLLRVPVLPLDVPPGNVCGAGIVQCEQGPQGIIVRFFADPQGRVVQIEVRGTSPQIAAPIQQIFNIQFK